MKKADLTINTIFIVTITIISIVLLLSIFMGKLPVFAKKVYCNTFFYVHKATFIPRGLRADQSYCKPVVPPIDIEIITEKDELNLTLVGKAVACWKKSEYGKYSKNHLCYELTIGENIKQPIKLTEENITQILINENMCEILPNNDTDLICGDEDKIDWRLGNKTYPEQNILIEYDAFERKIIIS